MGRPSERDAADVCVRLAVHRKNVRAGTQGSKSCRLLRVSLLLAIMRSIVGKTNPIHMGRLGIKAGQPNGTPWLAFLRPDSLPSCLCKWKAPPGWGRAGGARVRRRRGVGWGGDNALPDGNDKDAYMNEAVRPFRTIPVATILLACGGNALANATWPMRRARIVSATRTALQKLAAATPGLQGARGAALDQKKRTEKRSVLLMVALATY